MLAKGLTGTDARNSLVTVVAAAVLAALIVTTLYFGRDVFVPVALSILLSFALVPLAAVFKSLGTARGFCHRCRAPRVSIFNYFRRWRCHRDANDATRR